MTRAQHGAASRAERGGPTREYAAWCEMRQRCNSPRKPGYKNWGGRGIKICARWEKFADFFADMGPRPSPKHSVDRIDNDGDYEPGNVRWATKTEQARNMRNTRLIEFNGEKLSVAEWAERLNINASTLRVRLHRQRTVQRA